MIRPNDKLVLRNGKHVRFICSDPEDGACLIGEHTNCEDDGPMQFVTFERQDIVTVNGAPRRPTDSDRLNYVMPIITGDDDATANRRTAMIVHGTMAGHFGPELIDWAISKTPDFRF